MTLSLYTRISDLIPTRETFFDRVNHLLFNDPKRKMFRNSSLDIIFSSLKKAGIEGAELAATTCLSEQNIKIIKKMFEKYHLKIFSIHQSHDTYLAINYNEIERLCKIANKFSAHVIVLHINVIKNKLSDKTFVNSLKNLQEKYNVSFALENVSKSPFTLAKETHKTLEFSQIVNPTGFNITFDTTHLGETGENICEFYLKNKEKIINIHLSDYKRTWQNKLLFLTNGTHLPPGEGKLPILDFLKTLKKENYSGLITMEINADINKLCQNARMIKNAFR